MLVALGAGALSLWGVGPTSALHQNALDFLHIKALGAPATLLLMVAQARLPLSRRCTKASASQYGSAGSSAGPIHSKRRFRLPLQLPESVWMAKAPPAPIHITPIACTGAHVEEHCSLGACGGSTQCILAACGRCETGA